MMALIGAFWTTHDESRPLQHNWASRHEPARTGVVCCSSITDNATEDKRGQQPDNDDSLWIMPTMMHWKVIKADISTDVVAERGERWFSEAGRIKDGKDADDDAVGAMFVNDDDDFVIVIAFLAVVSFGFPNIFPGSMSAWALAVDLMAAAATAVVAAPAFEIAIFIFDLLSTSIDDLLLKWRLSFFHRFYYFYLVFKLRFLIGKIFSKILWIFFIFVVDVRCSENIKYVYFD